MIKTFLVMLFLLVVVLGGGAYLVWHFWISQTFQKDVFVVHNAITAQRDVQRKTDIQGLFTVLTSYVIDHQGKIPSAINERTQRIKTGEADICRELVPKYLPNLPHDPLTNVVSVIDDCNAPYDTGYAISKDTTGNITISAPLAEDEPISMTQSLGNRVDK